MGTLKKSVIIILHALVGWALCGAVMGVGQALLPKMIAMIIHLIATPVVIGVISANYYKRFNFTTPLMTAFIFTIFIILMDFFVVALLIMKKMEMFTSGFYSLIGTWLPFCLIFFTTYFVGIKLKK